ncbi:type II toxin-antitoxin system RelE/ParE family toxin [Candidatus Gottesmanbacteria bacterium]|nr:type II toxin-antitoxin system RelE/ParE family toxin [Candidatus Gottesmanbacteria bacterium]
MASDYSVYYFVSPVLILYGFIKKSQKTPLRELQTALTRYRQWKANNPFDK